MSMKKVIIYTISIIATFCIIIALAFTAMDMVIFNQQSYHDSFEKNELYEFIGVEKGDLHEITDEMLDYLKGKRPDLIMHAEIRGEYQQVFQEREILHMVDVQRLFVGGMNIRNITAIIGAVLLLLLFIMEKKKALKPLCKSYLWVMSAILAVAIVLGIIMIIDFNALFLQFHHLFFDNDLWLLDINTDVLIQMLPEEFFNEMALSIVQYLAVFILIPATLAGLYLIIGKNKDA